MRIGLGIGLNRFRGGQAGGATGILDSYTGAAFAFAPDVLIYGAHSVTDNAVGSATEGQTGQYTVRVRRSSDNAVSSFTYTEVSDGTLTTWVGAGNDGFVEAAYDQGTNGNHSTQGTAANQPRIVIAGSLVVENGKAALSIVDNSTGSVQQHLVTPRLFGLSDQYVGCFSVYTMKTLGIFPFLLGSSPNDRGFLALHNGSTRQVRTATVRTVDSVGNGIELTLNQQYLRTDTANRVNVITRVNGIETIDIADSNTNFQDYVSNFIGNNDNNVVSSNFNLNSIIVFSGATDLAPIQAAIETAINTEYNIYP